jgi:hypothetical protein
MNKVTRTLAMAGMALAASAAIGMSGASAASATTASPSADSTASPKGGDRFGKTRVVGYYRNALTCHRVGNLGEWRNRWDDHDCYRVRGNFRGSWVLVAKWNRHHGFPGLGHGHGGPGFPGHHQGGPGFPGHHQGGPGGFPGNSPWDQKKR